MFFLEQDEFTEEEARVFVEAYGIKDAPLNETIVEPIISILKSPRHRAEYIRYGEEFLQANSEMLSREFPTKAVSFPRMYVDNIFSMFGFSKNTFKENLKVILKNVSDKTEFQTIVANPTNVIHAVVLVYADSIQHRALRDSARQQMGLSIYNNNFNAFFHPPHPVESTMAYTYMNLDNSWNLVKSENIINWIDLTIETAFQYWRSRLDIEMDTSVLVQFLNRVRTSFRQNLRLLANQYFKTVEENKGNLVGTDVSSDDMYFESNNTVKLRDGLIRRINSKDQLYCNKGELYFGIAKLKNVKTDSLYEFAQSIEQKDISMIIDTIFYVFISKEGNTIEDINTTKYISRITNLPTAIDRALPGKPIIDKLAKKYGADQTIVRAYICLLATYIMYRINDVKS